MTATDASFAQQTCSWLAALQQSGKSKSTIDAYRGDLANIALTLETIIGRAEVLALTKIGQIQIDAMEALWTKQEASRATILRRFATLRGFSKFLCLLGYNCSGILAATLPTPNRPPPQSIPEEIAEAIAEPTGESWIELRNCSVVRILLETGATVAEVVTLNIAEVLWDTAGLVLAAGNPTARLVDLSDETLACLRLYRDSSPFDHIDQGPLFMNRNGNRLTARSVQVTLATMTTDLGLPAGASSRMLRHRYGLMLAERGYPLEVVADRMGISIATATKYFRLPRNRTAAPDAKKRSIRGRRSLVQRTGFP